MNLRREVSEMLRQRGFRRKDRSHLLRVDDQFSYCVDTGPLGKREDIAPFVGFRHDGVETAVGEFMGLEPDEWVATAGANVGYVLGQDYKAWQPPAGAAEVLAAIEAAMQRLRPFLSLDRLATVWDSPDLRDPLWRYRDIVVHLLRQQHAEIPARLEAARAEFCAQQDEICEQFSAFEQRVRAAM